MYSDSFSTLFLRPKETLAEANVLALEEESYLAESEAMARCPNCHYRLEDDYMMCPICQLELRKRCTGCRNLADLKWNVCAYCGTPVN